MLNAPRSHGPERPFRAMLPLLVLAWFAAAGRPVGAQDAGETPPFRLIGVIESRNFSGAVLDDSTGAQSFYRLREELPDGSRIMKVENDSVLVKRSDGSSYELFIIHDTAKPSAQAARAPSVAAAAAAPAASAALAARMERRAGAAGGDNAGRVPKSHRRDQMGGSGADQQGAGGPGARGSSMNPDDRRHGRQ